MSMKTRILSRQFFGIVLTLLACLSHILTILLDLRERLLDGLLVGLLLLGLAHALGGLLERLLSLLSVALLERLRGVG